MNNYSPIVVIGGGISGVSCVEQLAQVLPQKPLILISASDVIKVVSNFKRIGQTIDDFDVNEEITHYLINKYNNIEIIIDKVIHLKASKHELILGKGQTLKYDKLCVCLGSSPKQLPIEDSVRDRFSDYISVIRDTQTVTDFQNKLKNSKRVVIIGNGGIATELVHRIANCQMIWCIKDDCMGAPYFDPMVAKFFSNQLNDSSNESQSCESNISKRLKYGVKKPNEDISDESNQNKHTFGTALGPDWYQSLSMIGSDNKSVKIEYNCEVIQIYQNIESIDETKRDFIETKESEVWPVFVELTNGRIYGCDLIVCAIGVVPNTEPVLEGNHFSIGTDGGLIVNEQMLTTEPDVYAAGDVCSVGWKTSEFWFQMRLWTQARHMAIYAALCISAAINQTSADLYFNFDLFAHMTRFFGYKVVLLGLYNGQKLDQNQCQTLVRITPQKELVKVILRNGKMVGAILVGETDLEETFENLILNQIDLSSYGEHLLDSTIDIDDYFD